MPKTTNKPTNYRDPKCCLNCRFVELQEVDVTGTSAFGTCKKPYVNKRGRPKARNINVALFGLCDEHEVILSVKRNVELKPRPKEVYCCRYTHLLMELVESKSNVLWAGGTRPTKSSSAEEIRYVELRGECYNTPVYLTYSPVVADSNRLVTYDKFVEKCAELSPK